MKRGAISQREARRLRARVAELERLESMRRNAWRNDYPGGANIYTFAAGDCLRVAVQTARRCGCAVVAIDDGDKLRFYAVRP